MSIRLVRESSNTPNVTNRDDARMVNYAYGGYEGIVKDFGEELAYTTDGGVFRIGSGRVVLQGWEVDVGIEGWELDLSTVVGTFFYTIYLEVNLATEKANIISTYGEGDYPAVDLGDNLTASPSGVARMPLFRVKVTNGSIVLAFKDVVVMKHIRERLEELGFKQGVIREAECIGDDGSVLGSVKFTGFLDYDDPPFRLMKQGKIALIERMHISSLYMEDLPPSETSTLRFYIPEGFYPNDDPVYFYYVSDYQEKQKTDVAMVTSKSGKWYIDIPYEYLYNQKTMNIGWRIE